MSAFATLQNFARRPQTQKREQCDLCGLVIANHHAHLIEPATRKLLCVCEACSLLFYNDGKTKYKRVPRDARRLHNFEITDAEWDSLNIPIGLAFFIKSSAENKILAFYPSPAGPTESSLPIDIVPSELQPDVEALLVNRLNGRALYYIAPIDKCYELVGLIRANWTGLSGGAEVWRKIARFFECLT